MNSENIIRILLFLAGLFLGNRLAIGRDRRKEFNEVATPIYEKLREQEKSILENKSFIDGPSTNDFDTFERHLPSWKIFCFRRALKQYNKCQDENRYFQIRKANIINNPEFFITSIKRIKKFTKRK